MKARISHQKIGEGETMNRIGRSRWAPVVLCMGFAVLVCAGSTGYAAPVRISATHSAAAATCSPSIPAPTSTSGMRLAQAGDRFGFNLFHRLVAGAPKSDIFGVATERGSALDMLYDGARGGTASAMARTLARRHEPAACEPLGCHPAPLAPDRGACPQQSRRTAAAANQAARGQFSLVARRAGL